MVGSISGAVLDPAPEVVLALHACDTATDEALARAVEWDAPLVLAAPCCHHDVAAQLRKAPTPAPYAMLTRHGILRERLADTLTDALRASLHAAAGLPGRRGPVRREPAHAAQHDAARHPHGRAGRRRRGARRSTTSSWRRGASRPRLAVLLDGRRCVSCSPACSSLPFAARRLGGRGRGRHRRADLRATRRSSSPAGSRSSATCSSPPTTPATRAGCSPSTPPGDTVGTTAWSAEPTDVEALAPRGRRRGLGRRHRRQHRARATRSRGRPVPVGAARTSTPGPVVRARLPRRRPGRRVAAGRTRSPAASTSPARRSSAACSTRRPSELDPSWPQPAAGARRGPADRDRRGVLPRRPAPRGTQLRPGAGSTASPRWSRSPTSTCPSRSRARGSRSPPRATCWSARRVSTRTSCGSRCPTSVRDVVVARPPTADADRPERVGERPAGHGVARGRGAARDHRDVRAARGPGSSAGSSGSAIIVVLMRSLRRR